jgi:drug/metabolite transporter (DMT)-like permease
VLAAALLFSTGGAGIKVEAFTTAQVSTLRSGIAALALLVWLRGHITWSRPIAVTGVVYALTLTLFVAATKLTTAANAIFLQATAPLYLLVLAPVFLRERLARRDVAFLLPLAIGTVFCFLGQHEQTATAPNPGLGNILGAACGLVWALTLLALRFVGRSDRTGSATVSAVVAGNAFACLGALPAALPLPSATPAEWATIVYLGVCQIGLAYICLSAAMRTLSALEASLLLLLEPVLNPVWTWLIRGEDPGAWTIVGGAIIVAATAVKILVDVRAAAPAGEEERRQGVPEDRV